MMEFLQKLFGGSGGKVTMQAFDGWHFGWILFIAAAIVGAGFALRGRSDKTKKIALNALAIATLVFYIFDFFIQPFKSSDFTLNIDKLPFHICTVMSIIAVFAQFSKKDWFKQTAVMLAIAGALMYVVYPGTALNDEVPWGYLVVQTEVYHGMLLAWGILNLTSGQVKLEYKKMWLPLVGLCVLAVWATLGNLSYNDAYAGGGKMHHYDWLFLTGTTFGTGPYLTPFVTITAIYSVIALVYLIYYICQVVGRKISAKRATKVAE